MSACTAPPAGGDGAISAVEIAPLTPDDTDRLPQSQHDAIATLAARASPDPPKEAAGHSGHGGHGDVSPSTVPLGNADRIRYEEQWAAAARVASSVDTPSEAAAAGYTRASVQGAGVGTHWVNWTLVDVPFDPSRPSMLLFDERAGRIGLVGLSYWVRSDAVPDGFAGSGDVWHQHANLCVVNGWIDGEAVSPAGECAGTLLAGSDLWMLHAWVIDEHPNRWGPFATRHPALCPDARSAPDVAQCPAAP